MKIESKGLMINAWSNPPSMKEIAQDYDFVILRIGYGMAITQIDGQFKEFYKAAKDAGLKVGGYHVGSARTVQAAIAEANAAKFWIDGMTFDLPIFYMVGDYDVRNRTKQTEIIETYCKEIESKGFTSGAAGSEDHLARCTHYDVLASRTNVLVIGDQEPKLSAFYAWMDNAPNSGNSGTVSIVSHTDAVESPVSKVFVRPTRNTRKKKKYDTSQSNACDSNTCEVVCAGTEAEFENELYPLVDSLEHVTEEQDAFVEGE